jgi:hypothetical protein
MEQSGFIQSYFWENTRAARRRSGTRPFCSSIGLIERSESCKLHVPYETIHTEFDIRAANAMAAALCVSRRASCCERISGLPRALDRLTSPLHGLGTDAVI